MLNDAIAERPEKKARAQGSLRWAALFLGELRDGLTMVGTFCSFPSGGFEAESSVL
jgi:hypothetical protein